MMEAQAENRQCPVDLPRIRQTNKIKRRIRAKENQSRDASPLLSQHRKKGCAYKVDFRLMENSPYLQVQQSRNTPKAKDAKTRSSFPDSKSLSVDRIRKGDLTQDRKKADKKDLKVSILYKQQKIEFSLLCESVGRLKNRCRFELVNHIQRKEAQKMSDLCGFVTTHNHTQLDFILSFPQHSIPVKQLELKPCFRQYISKSGVSIKDFEIVKCLGSGGFSSVYLVKAKFDGHYYAMKLVDKKFLIQSDRESIIENQRFILGQITGSSFVIKMEFAFETCHHFALVLEYCPGGELFYQLKKVQRMTQDQARFYFLEILVGLNAIHQKKIIYRDIKPENLLIDFEGHIKITDFGLSKPVDSHKDLSYSYCGSPQYMAPQMLTKKGHNYLLDYYCLGALLYELVIGVPPYYSQNHQEIYNGVLNTSLSFPQYSSLSPELMSLLSTLLQKKANRRIGSLYGIKEIFLHPWVGKISEEHVISRKMTPPFKPDLFVFNFDVKEIQAQASTSLSNNLEKDYKVKKFSTHFSKEFYYEKPEIKMFYKSNHNTHTRNSSRLHNQFTTKFTSTQHSTHKTLGRSLTRKEKSHTKKERKPLRNCSMTIRK